MNAREFAKALLNTVADALPEDIPVSDDVMDEVDALVEKFLEPTVPVMKIDDDKRIVYGWASVISKNGQQIEDRQGDVIDVDDLRSAIHDFMKHRTAGDMHGEMGIGEVVESILLDASVQKSLGIDLGMEGWYVGVHVPNDAVWEKIKSGVYKAFSIGGSATREQVTSEDATKFLVVKGQGHMKAMGDGTPDEKSSCKCGKSPCKCKKGEYAKSGSYGKAPCKCGKAPCKCKKMTKFNPNHDASGRFASGGGMRGAGRSSRSAGSKLTGGAGPAKKKPSAGGSAGAKKAPAKRKGVGPAKAKGSTYDTYERDNKFSRGQPPVGMQGIERENWQYKNGDPVKLAYDNHFFAIQTYESNRLKAAVAAKDKSGAASARGNLRAAIKAHERNDPFHERYGVPKPSNFNSFKEYRAAADRKVAEWSKAPAKKAPGKTASSHSDEHLMDVYRRTTEAVDRVTDGVSRTGDKKLLQQRRKAHEELMRRGYTSLSRGYPSRPRKNR